MAANQQPPEELLVTLPVPYEVRRAFPAEWEMMPLLRGAEDKPPPPGPLRFLHPSLEVRNSQGRGRGVFATKAMKVGEFLMLDTPLLTASSYDALVEVTDKRAKDDAEFRKHLLSMCGSLADEAARSDVEKAPSLSVIRNIVRHNYHERDLPPEDGVLPSGPAGVVGLWPLASLLNHALRPNVARTFAGYCACHRLIRPLRVGDEVLDNYLNPLLPAAKREEMLRSSHGFRDEGPDACDAPGKDVAEILAEHASVMAKPEFATREAAEVAFGTLLALTNRCEDKGAKDPAFSDVFRDFAIVAGKLGDSDMCLQGYAAAFEFAIAREPYSVISYVLALRMLHMAGLARGKVEAETRESLMALARKHFRIVYGCCPGAFEAMNARLLDSFAEPLETGKGGSSREAAGAKTSVGVAPGVEAAAEAQEPQAQDVAVESEAKFAKTE